MSTPRPVLSTIAVAVTLSFTVVGCDASGVSSPTSARVSLPAAAPATTSTAAPKNNAGTADFSGLLLQPADLSDHEDTFAERSSDPDPKGVPGASALYVNADDTRAISDTIALYPDAATANATLQEAVKTSNTVVTGGEPEPWPVGTNGTIIRGTSPAGDKSVTLLMFTHDQALARLEFQSAAGDTTTDQFVTTIGKMQQIALRNGLTAAE